MAFNPTCQSGDFHYLVEFALDSTTIRYADEGLSVRDGAVTGYFYQGRLSSQVSLRRTLGTFLEPRETIDTFNVVVDNNDGALTTLVQANTFSNRTVKVFLGEGENKSDYSEVFRGYIAHPNGYRLDESQATFTVIDKREKDRRILPLVDSKYTTDAYPNIEKKARSTPISIVYGNWSSAAASGLSIPCVCTDQRATGASFKVASHGILSVDRYLKNASVLAGRSGAANSIRSTTLTDATFDISGYAYNATSDTVSVNCKGLYTANSTLIEKPADVLQSILTTYIGLTGEDMNGTAFHSTNTNTGPFTCRRVINTETSSEVLISELLNENSIDLRFSRGQYSPKFRQLDTSGRITMHDTDIVLADVDRERADFAIEYDPDRFYANQVRVRYQYDPIDKVFYNASASSDSIAIARDLATTERQMDFYWLYNKADAEARMDRELYLFSEQPAVANVMLTRRAMLKDLADQIDLDYSIFTNKTLQIRSVETNLHTMTTRVQAYDIFTDTFGKWMAPGSPNYAAATISQRQNSGFWCDASGLADPTDPQSDYSHWF